MCTDGKPCNDGMQKLGNVIDELRIALEAREYLRENRDAIKQTFESAYEAHPFAQKLAKTLEGNDAAVEKVKTLAEHFYMAGIYDNLRTQLAPSDDGEPEPKVTTSEGAEAMFEQSMKKPRKGESVISAQPVDEVNELKIEVPKGHVLSEAYVYDAKTKKTHHITGLEGKSHDEVKALIEKVLEGNG